MRLLQLYPLLLVAGLFLLLTGFKETNVKKSALPLLSNCTDTIPGSDTAIFEKVDEEAYFPGGLEGWRSFLQENLNGNVPVDKGAPEGTYTVFIQFVVSKDGKLSDIKPLSKHGFGMENEVMRIIRKSPPWVPAVQNNHPVNAYRKQPVTFQISVEKKKKRRS